MPEIRFVRAGSTSQPSSGYATRISNAAWLQYEQLVRRLHAQGTTRDDILRTLVTDHSFHPSIGQLRDQMARWGLKTSRKSRMKATSDADDNSSKSISCSDSVSGSDTVRYSPMNSFQPSFSYTYSPVTDDAFVSLWRLYDTGTLQYETAIEMEVLADVLFLGSRYVAAFNLYSFIYDAISRFYRFHSPSLAAVRLRSLMGCLRSCANSEQRLQIVITAEKELGNMSRVACCQPGDVELQRARLCQGALMMQFHERESFRFAVCAADVISTVSEAVKKVQLSDGGIFVLRWCFERLNTWRFVSTYNKEVAQSGGSVTYWTYGGSQSSIYWFLVLEAADGSEVYVPRFTVRHLGGGTYTLSICETFAIVAAMVSSEPWLFSLEKLLPEELQKWTHNLLNDNLLLDDLFQQAVDTVMMPRYATRLNKTKSDTLAFANGFPSDFLPDAGLLKSMAVQMSLVSPSQGCAETHSDPLEIDLEHRSNLRTSTSESLTREYAGIIESYVDENCAYGTNHQLREKPSRQHVITADVPLVKIKPTGSSTQKAHLAGSCDPMFTSSPDSSVLSSYRSFQSTHLRTRNTATKKREPDAMDLDEHEIFTLGFQFPLSFDIG